MQSPTSPSRTRGALVVPPAFASSRSRRRLDHAITGVPGPLTASDGEWPITRPCGDNRPENGPTEGISPGAHLLPCTARQLSGRGTGYCAPCWLFQTEWLDYTGRMRSVKRGWQHYTNHDYHIYNLYSEEILTFSPYLPTPASHIRSLSSQ